MLQRIPRPLLPFLILMLFLSACQGKSSSADQAQSPASSPGEPGAANEGAVPVSLPASRLDHAGDVDSTTYARKKSVAGGDVFVNGLYERPFNANTMDTYFPYLDIVDVQGFKDETWGYATITLANTQNGGGLPGQYAVELDLDRDGRGDWLIRASNVAGTDWSTQGVQAWTNSNRDVGGDVPLVADKRPTGGDGYDKLVFDAGNGSLTDGAWARLSSSDPKTIEIAFKLAMLGNPQAYALGAWAGANIDPALFDYNDHMTHAQAGSPNPGYDVYPIKQLAEIDNTCRLAIGFAASPAVPGLCQNASQDAGGGSDCNPRYSAAGLPCPGTVQLNPNSNPGTVSQFPGN